MTVYFNIVVIHGILLELGWLINAEVAVVDTQIDNLLGVVFFRQCSEGVSREIYR